MMRKVLMLILSCMPFVLLAQQTETEVQYKLRIKSYINAKDSVEAAVDREPTALGKEKIINGFFNGPVGKIDFFTLSKQIMQSELAVAYAAENNIEASNAYFSRIESPYTKADINRRAAIAFAKAGNQKLAVEKLKPILDSLLPAKGIIKETDQAAYSYAVQAYMEILTPGSESEVIHYLKPLYEVNGGYFPSDLSSKSDDNVKKKLFYRYAKALSTVAGPKEIAEVIGSAFQNGVVPIDLQASVVKDFSDVPDIQKYLAQSSAAGERQFNDSVKKLLAKTDINGKVWGAEALKGKYVLIDFWGSWCLPCRATHPHLKKVYDKYKEKGFEIVGIARESSADLQKAKQTWNKAVKEDGIDWIQLLANEGIASFDPVKAFKVGVFPTKILLSKDGTELARYSGMKSEEFDKKIKEIFGF